jgi:hypothetical protein
MQSATTQRLQSILLGAAMLALTPGVLQGQTVEQRARAEQNAHDRRHHNTAKTVGGTAAAGALIGGIAGGAPGALIGAGAGAGAGFVGDRVRKHYGTKKRARRMRERRAYRRHHAE